MSREIAEQILEIGAAGFCVGSPITFKSGIVSPVYCDNRRFPYWPMQWRHVIDGFARVIRETPVECEVIAGVEAAGIPHSAALGFAMSTPSVFVRKQAKEHGTKKLVEGGEVAGKRVVLVEDLVTTGMSSLAAIEMLRQEHAVVTDCLAIISYGFEEAERAFAKENVRLHALTTFEEVLSVGVASRRVSESDAASVGEWLRDPRGWGATR